VGCEYVQLDEVPIALLCDPAMREKVQSLGQNPDELVDLYINAINEAVSALPANVRVGVHMCRGNLKGRHLASGSYESVAERFFSRARINHFLLEFDTARAGDFSPLRFVPKGVGVVLGLVSSKTPELEKIDDLKRRVDEAAKYIAQDRLAISPQCGFASTAAGNPVTDADEHAKLKLCVDAARAIWS
jgi:5-methyltetrahydropteroyltriglutamate--homocysteine methyltransferase